MSSVLFDVPGPKARRRHRIYTVAFCLLLLGIAFVIVQRFRSEGVLTSEVGNGVFQNSNVSYLLGGLGATVTAAALAIVCSVVFGAVFAAGRLSDHRILRLPSLAVIEFFRAVPLVLLIILVANLAKDSIGLRSCLVVGLTLYNGSVLAEVYRAGIHAVPKGQSEAAYAMGMRKTQVMTIILMPQAVRFMLPTIISQCVIVLKDTSLGFIIGYEELVRRSRQVAQFVPDGTILTYATIAIVFIAINYSLSKLAQYLEHRLRQSAAGKPSESEALSVDAGA